MSENNSISLNKYISNTGICSRRDADKLIADGRVLLNGEIAQLGNRAEPGDIVLLDGKPVGVMKKNIYLVLNKPPGIICTTDTKEPANIVDFINHKERIFPVGRLDKPSEGLIILTNDGDIVNKILRGGNNHDKEYIVQVDKNLEKDFVSKMSSGIPIFDTVTKDCEVEKLNKNTFRIILTEGLNRQIRRMCKHLGYRVTSLKRIRIMNIHLGNLPLGHWRYLTKQELSTLEFMLKDSKKGV